MNQNLLAETLNGNLQQIVDKLNTLMNSFWVYSATRF